MFKSFTATAIGLMMNLLPANANDASKSLFNGNFRGVVRICDHAGSDHFYSPVLFKFSKTGTITGTVRNPDTRKVLQVKGSISRVAVDATTYRGKISGTFSDGTRWSGTVEAYKGVSGKIIKGKAKKGSCTGSFSLSNLWFPS